MTSRLPASKMVRVECRSFQAEMAGNDCERKPQRAEAVFGLSRDAVELGFHEQRTGLVCLTAQPAFSGRCLWEVTEAQTQQDPSFRDPLSYTGLTASAALQALKDRGFDDAVLPPRRVPWPPSATATGGARYARLSPKKPRKPTPSSPTSRPRITVTSRTTCA